MRSVRELEDDIIEINQRIKNQQEEIKNEICKRIALKYFNTYKFVCGNIFINGGLIFSFRIGFDLNNNYRFYYDSTVSRIKRIEIYHTFDFVAKFDCDTTHPDSFYAILASRGIELDTKWVDVLNHNDVIKSYINTCYQKWCGSNYVPLYKRCLTFLLINKRLKIFPKDIATYISKLILFFASHCWSLRDQHSSLPSRCRALRPFRPRDALRARSDLFGFLFFSC